MNETVTVDFVNKVDLESLIEQIAQGDTPHVTVLIDEENVTLELRTYADSGEFTGILVDAPAGGVFAQGVEMLAEAGINEVRVTLTEVTADTTVLNFDQSS